MRRRREQRRADPSLVSRRTAAQLIHQTRASQSTQTTATTSPPSLRPPVSPVILSPSSTLLTRRSIRCVSVLRQSPGCHVVRCGVRDPEHLSPAEFFRHVYPQLVWYYLTSCPNVDTSPQLRIMLCTAFENVIVEKKGAKNNVALITLNRPKALNALNAALMTDLANALDELESDADVAAIVLTGSQKAFAGEFAERYVIFANCE